MHKPPKIHVSSSSSSKPAGVIIVNNHGRPRLVKLYQNVVREAAAWDGTRERKREGEKQKRVDVI
jgi:hypothetical protein